MALLEVRNLAIGITKGNKHLHPVNGIDITINAGEIVALAGESGSGKTLTALSIMRLLPPTAAITGGSVLYDGDTASAGIAMIFQEPRQSLNPLMKVGPQIAEALELRGTDKKTASESALDMLRTLKLPDPEKIFGAWPHQLSGGMCQRVMIAIATIRRPQLLIADEPSSSLDTENRGNILDLLAQINREYGTAVLFITHDLSVAVDFCTRLLVMYAGRIIEEGPSQELFSAPMHPYTTALVGAIPRRENRGRPLANIPGTAPSIEDRPDGCPFALRCPKAQERCAAELPPLENAGGGRRVRCFFPGGCDG